MALSPTLPRLDPLCDLVQPLQPRLVRPLQPRLLRRVPEHRERPRQIREVLRVGTLQAPARGALDLRLERGVRAGDRSIRTSRKL